MIHITPRNIDDQYFDQARFRLTVFETRFGSLEFFIRDTHTITDVEVESGKRIQVVYQTSSYKKARQYIRDHSGE